MTEKNHAVEFSVYNIIFYQETEQPIKFQLKETKQNQPTNKHMHKHTHTHTHTHTNRTRTKGGNSLMEW